jgi:hypothetical protein
MNRVLALQNVDRNMSTLMEECEALESSSNSTNCSTSSYAWC